MAQERELNLAGVGWQACLFCLFVPVISALLVSMGLIIGIGITHVHLVAALVLSGIAAWLTLRLPWKEQAAGIAAAVVLIMICIGLSGVFAENTTDGRGFHLPAVSLLVDGWNPVYERSPDRFIDDPAVPHFSAPHIVNDAKSQYFAGAVVARIFGNTAASNYSHLLLVIVSIFIAFHVFGLLMTDRVYAPLLGAVAIGLNPISVMQAFSAMIDGVSASAGLISLLSLIGYMKTRQRVYAVVFVASFAFFLNVKLVTPVYGLIFVVIVCLGAWIGREVDRGVLKRVALLFIAACLFAGVMGVHPYVQNLLKHGNPIFPLMTSRNPATSTMPALVVKGFDNTGSYWQFWKTQVAPDPLGEEPWNRFHFTYSSFRPDTEMMVFGPLYGIALIMLLPLLPFLFRGWLNAGVVASCLIIIGLNPAPAIGRYVYPAWWAVAFASTLILGRLRESDRPALQLYAGIIPVILLVNAFMIGYSAFSLQVLSTEEQFYSAMRNETGLQYPVRPVYARYYASLYEGMFGEETPWSMEKDTELQPPYNYMFTVGDPVMIKDVPTKDYLDMGIADVIERHRDDVIIVAGYGPVTDRFSSETRSALLGVDSGIESSVDAGTYAAIIVNGEVAEEAIGGDTAVVSYDLPGIGRIHMESKLVESRHPIPYSEVIINGETVVRRKPSLTMTVIADEYEPCFTLQFDGSIERVQRVYTQQVPLPGFWSLARTAWFGVRADDSPAD